MPRPNTEGLSGRSALVLRYESRRQLTPISIQKLPVRNRPLVQLISNGATPQLKAEAPSRPRSPRTFHIALLGREVAATAQQEGRVFRRSVDGKAANLESMSRRHAIANCVGGGGRSQKGTSRGFHGPDLAGGSGAPYQDCYVCVVSLGRIPLPAMLRCMPRIALR